MGQEVLKDRNGKQIKKGDWIRYVFGEGDEVGGLKVVSQGGELGIIMIQRRKPRPFARTSEG